MKAIDDVKVVISEGPQEIITAKATKRLDVSQYFCPFTTYETVQAMNKLNPGEILEVLLVERASLDTMPAALRRRNYEFVFIEEGTDRWLVKIRKPSSTEAKISPSKTA